MYTDKLKLYFKKNGISQKEVSDRLGHAPAMISRFLSGSSVFDANFIKDLIREFPDIDLQDIFKDEVANKSVLSEPSEIYGLKEVDVLHELELIENRIAIIRKILARKSHEK